MQTVFSNSMTAHVWAQQQQPHGRNSTGSLYFNGPTIYSYGGHFPLARFEAGLTLVNSRDSSNTTAKHRHCMFQAIRHCRRSIVHVPMAGQSGDRNRTPEDHAQAIEHFDSLAYRTALKQKRARVHDYSASLANTLDQRTRYAEAFGLSWPDLPLDAAEMARQARTKQAEQYRQWRNGDPVNFPRSYAPTNGSVLLTFRALANGPHVLTSQGVTFPLEHARRAWRLIEGYYRAQDKAPKGASMFPRQDAAPIRLGRYTIDKIEPDGAIRARCHRVSRTEVERMGAILDTRPTAVDAVA